VAWPVSGSIPDRFWRAAWRQCAPYGSRGGTPLAAGGSTYSDCRRAAGLGPPAHSCRRLQSLTGFRLPVGEEIVDIDAGFQLSSLGSELTFIGSPIEFVNPGGITLGEVEGQNALGEGRSHPVSGYVEDPEQYVGVRFGAEVGLGHPDFILLRSKAMRIGDPYEILPSLRICWNEIDARFEPFGGGPAT